MIFSIALLIGMAFAFILIKAKSSWPKWFPAAAFFIGTIIIGVKVLVFPAKEMAILGDIMYLMILGSVLPLLVPLQAESSSII